MARKRTKTRAIRVAGGDPNHLVGPFLRTDLIVVICFGLALLLAVADRWPGVASLCIVAGLFAGISPRMEGDFGFTWGDARIGGTFRSPFEGREPHVRGRLRASSQPAEGEEERLPPESLPPGPPPGTAPDGG